MVSMFSTTSSTGPPPGSGSRCSGGTTRRARRVSRESAPGRRPSNAFSSPVISSARSRSGTSTARAACRNSHSLTCSSVGDGRDRPAAQDSSACHGVRSCGAGAGAVRSSRTEFGSGGLPSSARSVGSITPAAASSARTAARFRRASTLPTIVGSARRKAARTAERGIRVRPEARSSSASRSATGPGAPARQRCPRPASPGTVILPIPRRRLRRRCLCRRGPRPRGAGRPSPR